MQVKATLEEFCRNMSAALQNPSFETKQRILRLVVEKVVVSDEQIMIKHMIPISDVGLRRHQHVVNTPRCAVQTVPAPFRRRATAALCRSRFTAILWT